MTCIIGWVNTEQKDKPAIWIAGDTKITNEKGTLTLEGGKIMEIPIRVKDISTTKQPIYYQSTLGFAFAGSSLVAFNIHNALKFFISNIGGLQSKNQLPYLEQIAKKAQNLLGFYTRSVRTMCELFLSGKCPVKNELELYKICLEKNTAGVFQPQCYKLETDKPHFYFLGDKQAEMESEVIEMVEFLYKDRNPHHTRAPLYALRKVINEGKFETIGGGIQLGITYQIPYGQFELFSIWDKNKQGKPQHFHNNIDLVEEIGEYIGDCLIGIKGLEMKNYGW